MAAGQRAPPSTSVPSSPTLVAANVSLAGRTGARRAGPGLLLIAGASAAAAGMVIAGLAATDAMAATALTTPQIAAKVDPGLVDVVTTVGYQGGKAAGTGMVLTSTGEVLTNNHVIDGATSVKA